MNILKLGFAILVLITLMLFACGETRSINGEFVVDGTILKFENTVNLAEEYALKDLELEGGTMDVDLQGDDVPKINLQIKYREYSPSDATIYIENGKITAKTKSGKPMAITNISGIIPNQLNVNINTGTGKVSISNLLKANTLKINTGTGKVDMIKCKINELMVNTGTGAVSLADCEVKQADIHTGTGDIRLQNTKVDKRNFSMGTGDLIEE